MNNIINNFRIALLIFIPILLIGTACKRESVDTPPKNPSPPKEVLKVPKFQRDSAYNYLDKQVAFGPRVPNSKAHTACKNWMVQKFRNFGADVIEQDFTAKAYTGEILNGTNIIAQYNPQQSKRVILAAHWDSRHIADRDADEARQKEPILGADDGGSGVAVLMEIARLLNGQKLDLGIDIILFDLEDYGDDADDGKRESWCLGSQYWSNHFHKQNYRAKYGILLDMVGSKNARFAKEGTSMQYAPEIMNKVWKEAARLGFSSYFHDQQVSGTTDDHLFVNMIAKIPMIDIINKPIDSQYGFGHYWHTHKDNMDVIDKRTLRAVGQTVLSVLYKESEGKF